MAEDLFDKALDSKEWPYEKDFPEMREVIALLYQVIKSNLREACFQVVEKSVERFYHFGANTSQDTVISDLFTNQDSSEAVWIVEGKIS